MDGRGAAGAGRPGRTGRAGSPPPWWPEPPAPAARPASPARPGRGAALAAGDQRSACAPVRRTARPRSLRRARLPVPVSPGGLVALSAVAALVLAVGVPVALRGVGTSESTVTTPFLSYLPPPGWSAAPADAGRDGRAVAHRRRTRTGLRVRWRAVPPRVRRRGAAAHRRAGGRSRPRRARRPVVRRRRVLRAGRHAAGGRRRTAAACAGRGAGRAGRRHRHGGHGPGSRPGAATVRRGRDACSCWPRRSAAEPPPARRRGHRGRPGRSPLRRTGQRWTPCSPERGSARRDP